MTEMSGAPAVSVSLEEHLSESNAGFFLREFSFSRTEFQPEGGSEVQLADHVVSVDNILLVFQVKERTDASADPVREETWFTNKVSRRATRQIRDTLAYLSGNAIALRNDRGHEVTLPRGLEGLTVAKIVVYAPGEVFPAHLRASKGHTSSTAGFIHFFHIEDYETVLHTLVTLPEIVEYLAFRERLSLRARALTETVTETAILGHFLKGEEGTLPTMIDEVFVHAVRDDVAKFEVFSILHKFREKAYAGATQLPDRTTHLATDYYAFLKEMLRLSRTDLEAFKLRYMWAWERCGGEDTQPSRFSSGTTGCGFVFVPLPPDAYSHAATALENLTVAAKYDLRVDRCIGLVFRRDGEYRLVDWMFYEAPWELDAELEQRLKDTYPFRETKAVVLQRYRFD